MIELKHFGIEQHLFHGVIPQTAPDMTVFGGAGDDDRNAVLGEFAGSLVGLRSLVQRRSRNLAKQFVLKVHPGEDLLPKPELEGENVLLINNLG